MKKSSTGKDFDFSEYKKAATKDDVKKFEDKMKPKKWENIPLFGSLVYAIRMYINYNGIDRGTLRKEIFIQNLIFMACGVLYIYIVLMYLTPWFLHWMYSIAIRKTKEKIKNNDL